MGTFRNFPPFISLGPLGTWGVARLGNLITIPEINCLRVGFVRIENNAKGQEAGADQIEWRGALIRSLREDVLDVPGSWAVSG
jgi:hypothetical protein